VFKTFFNEEKQNQGKKK